MQKGHQKRTQGPVELNWGKKVHEGQKDSNCVEAVRGQDNVIEVHSLEGRGACWVGAVLQSYVACEPREVVHHKGCYHGNEDTSVPVAEILAPTSVIQFYTDIQAVTNYVHQNKVIWKRSDWLSGFGLRPMQTDSTSHNIVACCWGILANNVASVCMGLKVWSVSNYTQQVPTLLWFHANGHNVLGATVLRVVGQQCCIRLHGPLRYILNMW